MKVQTPSQRDAELQSYLDSFVQDVIPHVHLPRTWCCGQSACIYCPECGHLLFDFDVVKEKNKIPTIQLPFDLDIVLDDKRRVATGLHAHLLCNYNNNKNSHDDDQDENDKHFHQDENDGKNKNDKINNPPKMKTQMGGKVRLMDLERGDVIPDYYSPTTKDDNNNTNNNNDDDDDDDDNETTTTTTCVLFPSPDSIPLSQVAHTIQRLIVLDCKWTRPRSRQSPLLSNLTKVHLTSPPSTSHYWRWHNTGPGMISTIEAIYCAAWEVQQARRVMNINMKMNINEDGNVPSLNKTTSTLDLTDKETKEDQDDEDEDHIIHSIQSMSFTYNETSSSLFSPTTSSSSSLLPLLFLFGLQRALIHNAAIQEGRSLPFSEQGKQEQRALRKKKHFSKPTQTQTQLSPSSSSSSSSPLIPNEEEKNIPAIQISDAGGDAGGEEEGLEGGGRRKKGGKRGKERQKKRVFSYEPQSQPQSKEETMQGS